jgi:hypothetical protein
MSRVTAVTNFDKPMLHASGETSADAPIVRPSHILAFEIPDDSMHPRAMKGEFAIIEGGERVDAEAGDEVLVQLADGRWQVRTLVRYLDATVTLSAYNLPPEVALDRGDIAAIYRVDLIVPVSTFALMTDNVVCWKVCDARGNEYGTFADHGEAHDFGNALADRLELDEVRFCRVLVPTAELAKAEVSHV